MPVDILAHIIGGQLSTLVNAQRPAAALLHVVDYYCWYTHGHNGKAWAALDGQPALLFLLNEGALTFTGKYEKVISHGCFCNGTLENTYLGEMDTNTRLLVIKFKADGYGYLKTLLPPTPGAPIMELPAVMLELLASLRTADSRQQQAVILNTFLEQRLPDDIIGNFLLQRATNIIKEQKGQITVVDICTRLHVNYKWLERNFRTYTGVTPKQYISNIRFLHTWIDVQQAAQPLTSVALNNGYYDQNHFIKAYKKYTGRVPSAVK